MAATRSTSSSNAERTLLQDVASGNGSRGSTPRRPIIRILKSRKDNSSPIAFTLPTKPGTPPSRILFVFRHPDRRTTLEGTPYVRESPPLRLTQRSVGPCRFLCRERGNALD